MRSIRLRYLAAVNPATPEFDRVAADRDVTFMPLEAVWADGHHDASRTKVKAEASTGYTRFRNGDILLPKVTPTFQAGRVARVSGLTHGVGAGTTELHVLRARPEVDPRFVAYALRSKHFIEEGVTAFQGVAGLQRVPDRFVRDFEVADLSLDEQRRIADFLDAETARIGRLVELRDRQAEVLKERLTSEVENAWLPLDDGARLGPLDVPRDGEVPADWIVRPLGSFLRRITYGFTNPMPQCDDGPYLLTANDISDGAIGYDTARMTTEEAFRTLLTAKSRPKRGDILMTKDGTLGRVAEADGTPCCINQSVALLEPLPEFADGSLTEALRVRAYREALIFNAGGSTIKHLYITRVAKQTVGVPSDVRARRNVVRRSREVRAAYQRLLAALAHSTLLLLERRQALITGAVTGQFDVTTARGVA